MNKEDEMEKPPCKECFLRWSDQIKKWATSLGMRYGEIPFAVLWLLHPSDTKPEDLQLTDEQRAELETLAEKVKAK